jgi:hypothetical protein
MGMYVYLRGQIRIKPEYLSLIETLHKVNEEVYDNPGIVAQASIEFPLLEPLLTSFRGPYCFSWMGGSQEDWEKGDYPYSFIDGLLTFEASIKGCSTPDRLGELFDIIAEEIIFYSKWYEEDRAPHQWKAGGWKQECLLNSDFN